MKLFFDTETTGMPDFHSPATDPSMPHIVQLGAILCDDKDNVVASIDMMVKPNGWLIPPEASAIHGVTQEAAEKYGFEIGTVIDVFLRMCDRAELLVAHNYSFDEKMIRGELHRVLPDAYEPFRERPSFCTMRESANVLKLPGKRGFKWPTLREAFTHFTGAPFVGAHRAMADAQA